MEQAGVYWICNKELLAHTGRRLKRVLHGSSSPKKKSKEPSFFSFAGLSWVEQSPQIFWFSFSSCLQAHTCPHTILTQIGMFMFI